MENCQSNLVPEDVKAAFLQCVSRETTAERDVYLAELELRSPALAAEVRCLLSVAERGGPIDQVFRLAVSAESLACDEPEDLASRPTVEGCAAVGERPGTMIGPYKLLEQIGEGGMGTVFMAQQSAPIKRRVALKIIKPGTDTRQVIARFEAERQALAMMDHPNIAKVLDAGATEQGRPYFVMELVRGIPITEFCQRQQLCRRTLLQLFLEVCRGVQHAHQKGIIHRDLKPSNVLVTLHDGTPVPKIIDFGVAKALHHDLTDQTLFTQFAQMIGTPLYMSPEQAALSGLDVDTRSDVYSLGVLLYELLTGSTPLDRSVVNHASMDEVRRMIREEQPPRPSQRLSTLKAAADVTHGDNEPRDLRSQRRLQRELDWVVMKSLEKERERRYESVSAQAADIDRYLHDQPVEACPPSAWYRTSKYVRRHRGMLLTTAAVMLTLVAGAGASLWQAVRATRAEQRAREGSQLARQVVDDMYTQVAEKWLANEGTLTDVQREFLEKALAFYTQLPQDADTDPAVLHESRQALSRVAALYNALGHHEQAVKSYQDLIAKCRGDLQRANDESARRIVLMDLIREEGNFSHLYQQLGQFDAAKSLAATAYQDAQPLLAQETALGDPDDRYARLLNSLASTLLRADRLADATQVNKRAQQMWDTLATRDANSVDTRLGWVNARIIQGDLVESGSGDRQQAEAALREADQKLSVLCAAHPENRELRFKLVTVLERLRQLCWNANRKTEAIALNGRAIPMLEKLVQEFPEDRYYLRGLVGYRQAQHHFGLNTQLSAAELALVRQQWYAAAKTQMERFPRFFISQQQLVHSAWWLGYSLSGAGKYAEARAVTREVMASIPFTSLSTDGDKKGSVLVVELAQLSALHATLELQLDDYVRAADFLQNLPDVYRTYASLSSVQLPEGWVEEDHPDTLSWVIASFGHTLEECAVRAEQDDTLGPDERSFRAAEYRAQAAHFRNESDLATSAWVHTFSTRPGLDDYVFTKLAGLCGEITPQSLEAFCVPVERDFYRQYVLQRCKTLLKEASKHAGTLPKMHYVVGTLVAGPAELRDPELALQIARQAAAALPDDALAHQSLAWALGRAGKWQECRDCAMDDRHKLYAQPGCRAFLAMASWHLGEKSYAAECLNDSYVRAARQCIHQTKEGQGAFYPSPEMLQSLDREARELLGIEPVDWDMLPPDDEVQASPVDEPRHD